MSHSQSLADGISVISGPWEAMKPYCGCGAKAHPNDKVACPPNQGQAHKPSAVFQRLTQSPEHDSRQEPTLLNQTRD